MSPTQNNPFQDVVNWRDVQYALRNHLYYEFVYGHIQLPPSINRFSDNTRRTTTREYIDYRAKVVCRCCDVIWRLWIKGYLFGSKMRCIKYQTDGSVRLYGGFIKFAVRIMKTIIHVDGGGEKIAEVTDIDDTCALSEKKMVDDHLIKENTSRSLKNIMKHVDYDGIKEITHDDYGFRNIDTTGEILSIFQNFTDKLREMNIIKENYEMKTTIARRSKASHRLNLRARDFTPWKLYVSAPVYTDIIGTMMYDESDSSTFNTQFIIPEDIGRIITEFVGHNFLTNIRRIIMNSDKTKLTKDINDSLSKLKKDELMMIAKKSPYNYINFNKTYNFRRLCPIITIASLTKPKLIEAIMTSFKNKEQYYPFYRDTVILSRIILDNRSRRKQREHSEWVAIWRASQTKVLLT